MPNARDLCHDLLRPVCRQAGWKKKYEEKGDDGLVPRYGRKESSELKKLLAEKELELSMKTELLKKKMAQWKIAKK